MEYLAQLRELARQLSTETNPIKTKEILDQILMIMAAHERAATDDDEESQ